MLQFELKTMFMIPSKKKKRQGTWTHSQIMMTIAFAKTSKSDLTQDFWTEGTCFEPVWQVPVQEAAVSSPAWARRQNLGFPRPNSSNQCRGPGFPDASRQDDPWPEERRFSLMGWRASAWRPSCTWSRRGSGRFQSSGGNGRLSSFLEFRQEKRERQV